MKKLLFPRDMAENSSKMREQGIPPIRTHIKEILKCKNPVIKEKENTPTIDTLITL